MPIKILIIDNTFDPPHGCPEIQFMLHEAANKLNIDLMIESVRAPESKIPTDFKKYNGVVISGSKTRIAETAPWIELEMQAMRTLEKEKIPTFAICYGEQLIVRALAGEQFVSVAKNSEHGWVSLTQLEEGFPLFKGLNKDFISYELHFDEVLNLPSGFKNYATSKYCTIQAFTVESAPMWCVQFHPERQLAEGNRSLDVKLAANPAYNALNRKNAEQIYDPTVGQIMFQNFLQLVKENAK